MAALPLPPLPVRPGRFQCDIVNRFAVVQPAHYSRDIHLETCATTMMMMTLHHKTSFSMGKTQALLRGIDLLPS